MKNMTKILDCFKMTTAVLGTFFTWLFGSWDTAIVVLVMFMVLDYITGVIRAYINKEVSSDVGLKGLTRKLMILFILIVAVALDRLMDSGTWIFRTLVCYFYIANEGISLTENAAGLGLPIPQKLVDALAQLKEGQKKDITESEDKGE